MIGLSTLAPMTDLTTWTFAVTSLPLNAYLTYLGKYSFHLIRQDNIHDLFFLAWNFHKESDSKSSRKLFRFTLVHLPALIVLMIISKKESEFEESIPS